MLKQLLSIFLITAVLLQSFSSMMIIAGYEINRDYIAKNLCENKNKPSLHCCGKCHLKKELIAEEKKQSDSPSPLKEKQEIVQFFQTEFSLNINNRFPVTTCNSFYIADKAQDVLIAVFHPPTV